jgi:hypothetical protein
VTDPAPNPTLDELTRALIDASRALMAAIRARPRDQQAIDDASAELADLRALKASLYPGA